MKKIYSSLLLVIAFLCLGVQNVKAEAGFWSDNACSISLYHSGVSSDTWYGSNSTGADNVALGTVTSLYLKGFWFKMWEKTDGDINNETTAYMNYYICKTSELGNTTPTWTTVYVSSKNYGGDWSTGSQNITLENEDLDVNLLSGLTAGDYTLVYYFYAEPYSTGMYLSNNSQNYTVTFTVPTTIGLRFTSSMTNKIADAEKYDKITMTYQDDDWTDYNYDLSPVTALHTQTDVSSVVGSETASPYVAPADGSYLLEYIHSGNDTKTVEEKSYKYLYGKLTIHPVTHVAYKAPTTAADGNEEYWYCEENNVKRYWVDKGGSNFAETTLADVTLAKLNTLTVITNTIGTLAANGNVTAGVFTPETSGFYSFTANSENVYVNVSDETGSNSASGTQTCTLECTAGTAYTVTCYNRGSSDVDLKLTIAKATNPYTEVTVGGNDVTVAHVDGYNYNPTHTFTPTESGDYKFTISTVENGTNFIVASSSSIMNAMYSGSYVSGGSTGEAVMLDMEANHKYYIMLATEGEALNATFTISKTTVKDKAVYKDGTLTFYCDEKNHSSEGTVYKIINYTNSFSNHVAWDDLNEDVTKVVFDETFANATPDDCYGWFGDFSNLTTVEGLENVNMSNVEDTERMFDYCTSLTSITIPASWKSIGRNAFRGCTALTTVNLKSVPAVGTSAFDDVNSSCAYKLTLTDDSYVAAESTSITTATTATYTRAMSNNWGTVVLPFAVTYDADNTDYNLYYLSAAGNSNLTFTEYADNAEITAGTPMAVKALGDKNAEDKYTINITANGTAVSTAITAQTSTVNTKMVADWTMNGTYSQESIGGTAGNGVYFIASNKFYRADATTTVNPFRAWFEGTLPSGEEAKSFNIVEEDETDGISLTPAISEGEGVSKYLENGKVVIVKNGQKFNVNGQVLK